MKKKDGDSITGHEWVGLTSMVVFLSNRMNKLKELVIDNDEGGLTYLIGLSIIHDEIVRTAIYIEDTLNIRTWWVGGNNIGKKHKDVDIANDYFYSKLKDRVDTMLRIERKEGCVDDGDEPC